MSQGVPTINGASTYMLENITGGEGGGSSPNYTGMHQSKAAQVSEWTKVLKELGIPVEELMKAILYGNKPPATEQPTQPAQPLQLGPAKEPVQSSPIQYKSPIHKQAIEEINKRSPTELLEMVQMLSKSQE